MEMRDMRLIAATQGDVWKGLLDPEVLMICIPGCKELHGTPDAGFEATVVQRVGPIKATFEGFVQLLNVEEPISIRIEGKGSGGRAGYCSGGATIILTPNERGTKIVFDVDVHIGGRLAKLGGRIIDSFATKMADRFFDSFKITMETAGAFGTAKPAVKQSSGWLD